MELTSPRTDLSEAIPQADQVEIKTLEFTTIHDLTSVPSSFSKAFTRTFPSPIASSSANVSAEVMDLTGHRDLCELQDSL